MTTALSPTTRFYQAAGDDRRSRMQARLMDAAVSLFAEVGVDSASVLEIANRAGVANGTFYNYFRDKEEIVDAVYNSITESLISSITLDLDKIPDARDQIALGTIWFIDAVASEPYWGRMVVNALEQSGPFRERCSRIIASYIEHGLAQTFFDVECTPVFLDLFISVLVAGIRARLERGEVEPHSVDLVAAETHLRMVGTPIRRAHEVPRKALREHGEYPGGPAPMVELRFRHRKANPSEPGGGTSKACG